MGDRRSKEDHVQQISTSIFITNFPEQFTSRDLWRVCQEYGRVVDAYIPNRRSKTGGKFGFVCFIQFKDVDRLGSQVNDSSVRYNSYARDVKLKEVNHGVKIDNKHFIVLDDSCILQRDFSLSLMGKVLDFGSLSSMKMILAKDGFDKLNLKYMGGFWILYASNSFMIDERVAWLDIEGVPLKAWTKNTFTKISAKWGEFLFEEDKENYCLNSKRLCIKTKMEGNIFESFKIIVHGKIHWIRVKEVSSWVPDFMQEDESDIESDEEIDEVVSEKQNSDMGRFDKPEGDIDNEVVYELIFEEEHVMSKQEDAKKYGVQRGKCVHIRRILKRRVASEVRKSKARATSKEGRKRNSLYSGSNNGVQDGWAEKDVVKEYVFKIKINFMSLHGTIMENVEQFCIKNCWGNLSFEFVCGPSVGNSGGEWIPNSKKYLIISVYAPQEVSEKKRLWDYFLHLFENWNGEIIIMGDFNEVRSKDERYGSLFNVHIAAVLNSFISLGGLVEVPLRAWFDYGPVLFRLFHYWFEWEGFDKFVTETWESDNNVNLIAFYNFMKKLKCLKEKIRVWTKAKKESEFCQKSKLKGFCLKLCGGLLSLDPLSIHFFFILQRLQCLPGSLANTLL
ncbi:RNA-directed DNA polymerase, eukaryota [Tanacetum coccineum]